jgi:hypothetical protein
MRPGLPSHGQPSDLRLFGDLLVIGVPILGIATMAGLGLRYCFRETRWERLRRRLWRRWGFA